MAHTLAGATFDRPAQEIVVFRFPKLTTVSGAALLDAHFDWPAQEIVAFKLQI